MKRLEIIDQPDELRTLAGECELTGRKTAFDRNGRPVAVLVSWDEYLALRETIDIARDPQLVAAMRKSEAEVERGEIEQPSDDLPRIRVPRSLRSRLETDETAAAVRAALARIDDDPIAGAPLFEPMRGLWSYREGTLRIVYRIVAGEGTVLVLLVVTAEAA